MTDAELFPADEGEEEWAMRRSAFLASAASAAALLADPAVAAAWDRPSALAKVPVSGLAGHLLSQILVPRELLASQATPGGPPLSVMEHYASTAEADAGLDSESTVAVHQGWAERAGGGPAAVAGRAAAELGPLRVTCAAEPPDRVVYLPWRSWSLRLDDFLLTRTIEIAVHNDDLALSAGVPAPALPAYVQNLVLQTLVRVAVRRHGGTALLRVLTRTERAPASVSVF
jgi:hypothetical protein